MIEINILHQFQVLFDQANIDTKTAIKNVVLARMDPVNKYKKDAIEILNFLNGKRRSIKNKSRGFAPVKVNVDMVSARLKEGATVGECKQVIAMKCRTWRGTDMEPYLRPLTLFNRSKFWQYHGELQAIEVDGVQET